MSASNRQKGPHRVTSDWDGAERLTSSLDLHFSIPLDTDPTYTFLPPDAKPEVYHPTYQGLVKYLGLDANRTMVEEEVGKLNETQRGVGELPGEWVACIVRFLLPSFSFMFFPS